MNFSLSGMMACLIVCPSMMAQAPSAPVNETIQSKEIVVSMSPCSIKRQYDSLFARSSKFLVFEGQVQVGGESFKIYLPKSKRHPYSIKSRAKPSRLAMTQFSSTYLAVDQNHDGKLSKWESYYAELPLRIGDTMFDVKAIALDGSSITLHPNDGPLLGAVIGRRAPDFSFTTVDGKVLKRDDFKGKAVLIDCWAPG